MADSLKAGRVDDFDNSMASYMAAAMEAEWEAVRGAPLAPGAPEEDRRILFAAVAQGVLKYLHDNQSNLRTNTRTDQTHDHQLSFSITGVR